MVRGFYQLASGMLSCERMLGGISQNMANVKTTGYKRQATTTSAFESMLIDRLDNERTAIGSSGMKRVVSETVNIHSQGSLESTGRSLDVAIEGNGFFAVQDAQGTRYTRKGDFNLDAEGYLVTASGGRVLSSTGAPILLNTDAVSVGARGELFVNGAQVGQLGIYDFADYGTLATANDGFYTGTGAAQMENPVVLGQTLEGSNVDTAQEMTDAMTTQRNLQSCAQMLKMYDQVLARAVSEIGKL